MRIYRIIFSFWIVIVSVGLSAQQQAIAASHPGAEALADELAAETAGKPRVLTREAVMEILANAEYRPDIITTMKKPAESKPWKDYRPIFMTEARLRDGVAYGNQHKDLLDCIEKDYGVPKEIILAIVGVETQYGKNIGKHRVIDALTTLALYYPPRQTFFRAELKTLVSLPTETFPQPINQLIGSYAGAMGLGQFMPSSYAAYAVDRDDDGAIDLWNSPPDILASVANYLAEHGWQKDQPIVSQSKIAERVAIPLGEKVDTPFTIADLSLRGIQSLTVRDPNLRAGVWKLDGENGDEHWLVHPNFKVIMTYNRSPLYAMAVTQFAESLGLALSKAETASR